MLRTLCRSGWALEGEIFELECDQAEKGEDEEIEDGEDGVKGE